MGDQTTHRGIIVHVDATNLDENGLPTWTITEQTQISDEREHYQLLHWTCPVCTWQSPIIEVPRDTIFDGQELALGRLRQAIQQHVARSPSCNPPRGTPVIEEIPDMRSPTMDIDDHGPVTLDLVRQCVASFTSETAGGKDIRDPEVTHVNEDKLYLAVLRQTAAGHPDAQAMAQEALKVHDLDFTRWWA